MSIIHVVGTGTIGEPLVGLFCSLRKLGVFESDTVITFQKETPESKDRFKVNSLKERGAIFAAAREKSDLFVEAGMAPDLTQGQALDQADIVIDCTPYGLRRKKEVYLDRTDNTRLFVAQGNAGGFGPRFAAWINDDSVYQKIHEDKEQFVQVVSCNTHAILATIRTIAFQNGAVGPENLVEAQTVILRRANDVSQSKGFVPSPQGGAFDDEKYGTHQARDAALLLLESFGQDYDVNLRSSVFKVNSQLMHTNWFDIKVRATVSRDDVIDLIKANPLVATTEKDIANEVFSSGRDHGYFGRILNQVVIPIHKPSAEKYPLTVFPNPDGTTSIKGCSFTPQDGNSLVSTAKVALIALYPNDYQVRANVILGCRDPRFVFSEI